MVVSSSSLDIHEYELDSLLEHKLSLDLQAYNTLGLVDDLADDQIPKWNGLLRTEPQRFIDDQQSINFEAIRNFRRLQIFVPDSPGWDRSVFKRLLRKSVTGGGRGLQRMMRECLDVILDNGYGELLNKYPCHPAGKPYVFSHKGYKFTYRWVKHIYFLGLLKRILGAELEGEKIALDVGSSYGIFSSLLKKEYPESHHVLVDFPEQLLLARYFLGMCFPEAKIASVSDFSDETVLNKAFFMANDFTLIPIPMYGRIQPDGFDLVSNFASFGEMSRSWFNYYMNSSVFKSSKYFLTANRIQSYPTYDTDLTVVDYPVWDHEKRMHFGISPIFSDVYYYLRKNIFFNRRFAYPPYFEYIGII